MICLNLYRTYISGSADITLRSQDHIEGTAIDICVTHLQRFQPQLILLLKFREISCREFSFRLELMGFEVCFAGCEVRCLQSNGAR